MRLLFRHAAITQMQKYGNIALVQRKSFLPVRYNKKEDDNRHPLLSGYCDSNTGPSGPKPDALANCATPRIGLQR